MGNNEEKSAIVIVGGAFRSAYYSGSLKALDELGVGKNFDTYVAISAGAPVMSYFLTEQMECSSTIWCDYVPTKHVYNPKNILTKKPIIDLDYLINEVFFKEFPLKVEKLKDKNFFIPLLNYDTGNIEYFKSNHENLKEILKAAMSIPWLSRKIYEIDNKRFVDAAIAENLVIKKLIEDGHTKILLLISHSGIHDLPNWRETIIEKLFFLLNPKLGKITKKLILANIEEALNLFNNKKYKIITVSPTKYHLARFENSKDKIAKNIQQGYDDIINNKELKEKILDNFQK